MAEYIEREALLHDIEQSVVYTTREKITSAEMRGAHKIIERIKCAPAVEPIYIHEPTKSEFKRMAVQMGYVQVVHGRWIIGVDDDNFDVKCSKCGWTDIFEVAGIAAVERIAKTMHYCLNCGARMDGGVNDEKLDAAPTVDAVEVVRCKDCEHAERYERADGTAGYYCGHPQNSFTYGERWDRVFKPVKETDGFCSYGARKDEENG